MAYWWVNHSQSWKDETGQGVLWSPTMRSNGGRHQPYDNMRLIEPGDIVFSFANAVIGHVGVAEDRATSHPKPLYAKDTNWGTQGWLVPVAFEPLPHAFRPRDYIGVILPLLPQGTSPLMPDGRGTMNYLSAISDELGEKLLSLGGASDLRARYDSAGVDADLRQITSDPSIPETEKAQLLKARVGQGTFRKRVAAKEPYCRVTGVSDLSLLRASHIKPWKSSTNAERLDGSNGLMLAPHIDLLFDQHLISFAENGSLILSPLLSTEVVQKWAIKDAYKPRPFTTEQEQYLQIHRQRTLEFDTLRTRSRRK